VSFLAGVVGFLCGSSLAGFCAYRIIHLRLLSDILLNPQNQGEAKFLQEVARTLHYCREAFDIPGSGRPERQTPLDDIQWLGLRKGAACLVDGIATMHDGTTVDIASQLGLISNALVQAYVGLDEASVVLSGMAERMSAADLANHPSQVMRAIAGQTDMYPLQVPLVGVARALGIDPAVNELGTGGAALWERTRKRLVDSAPEHEPFTATPDPAELNSTCLELIRVYGQTIEAITSRIANEPRMPGACVLPMMGAARLADAVEHLAQDALCVRPGDSPEAKRRRLREDLDRLVNVLPGITQRLGNPRRGQPFTLPAQQQLDHLARSLESHPMAAVH